MKISIVTLEGCNEIDSFVAFNLLNRVRRPGWTVRIAAPTPTITSGGGITITAQETLGDIATADAVLIGSGKYTARYADDPDFLAQLKLDARRQLVGAQCSGTMILHELGLLDGQPACTDTFTRPHLEARGMQVLDKAFHCDGNIATAGGCLASSYLAAWTILRLAGAASAAEALHTAAPVGEKEHTVSHAFAVIGAPPLRAAGKAG
jgi:transcriptional regulator GlxA family with amidase domain